MDNDPHVDNNIKLSPNQQEKLGYLYIHTRLDTNEVFYVGISRVDKGKYKRSKDKRQRNNKWKDVINNTEYKVDIILDNIPYNVVKEKEREFILLYGRIDLGTGTLVNKTSGGQGACGRVYTPMPEERRKRIGDASRGRKHTEEAKKLIGDASRGNKNCLGYKHTEEARKNMSKAQKGKKHTQEAKDKIGESKKGNTYTLGKKHTQETIEKMRNRIRTPEEIEKSRINRTGAKITQEQKDKTSKKVGQYKEGNLIKEYPSLSSVTEDGFCVSGVSLCANGKQKSHKGFEWNFILYQALSML